MTWQGIAEAASTGTFERLQGTATVTIADLSLPRVGVAIDVRLMKDEVRRGLSRLARVRKMIAVDKAVLSGARSG